MKKIFILLSIVILAGTAHAQQLNIPKASPTQKLEQEFGTSKITVEYSRPGVKGREIYGGLVPYDSVWRTGANSSTKIFFGDDVMIEGNRVPMGNYALYTIPGRQSWTIIISKDTTLWGAFGYKKENDLIRFNVKPQPLPFSLETFTIDFANIKPAACDIDLLWDKTFVRMHITMDIDPKIMAQINEAMKNDKPPYAQAATYYFDNGKDLSKAYEWINKAIEARPESYGMLLTKAKIEMKMGKKGDAVTTAQKAKELSLKDHNMDDARQADAIIAEAKSK